VNEVTMNKCNYANATENEDDGRSKCSIKSIHKHKHKSKHKQAQEQAQAQE
jgi:hypothetical protein